MTLQRLVEHHLAKVLATVLRNLGLLLWIAVVLERQNHRVIRSFKCALGNRFDNFLQTIDNNVQVLSYMISFEYHYLGGHFGNEGVPVIDDGVLVFAVPKVQLDAATPTEQSLPVDLHRRLASELVS